MILKPFEIIGHNSHYEGTYSDEQKQWKKLCAVEKVRNLCSLLPAQKYEGVLEVGCGTGAVLIELAKRNIFTFHHGIDVIDPNENAEDVPTNVNMSMYNGCDLPFQSKSVDVVYASHVIEHVMEPRQLLAEIARVAKSWIYIEVPCELHARTSRKGLQSSLNIGHINCYSPASFMILLQSAGLDVVEMEVFDHDFAVHRFFTSPAKATAKMALRRALININRNLATKVFTYHCGALCRAPLEI
ncbi:class I SAM-dependent methyltransferase [Mesorhizobium sp.]|uniref:class I SAM-dependent methyltransferase n=1 Tax=Mesorhizobium sp. TaxID=1871066 RepID=UPI000FE8BBB5|nr:class I SAM-dependent methyltransferase [Mesorhizobium sp.]RWO92683.1 MAG: class I SAM-dependent methyltransferase [Mesorhizobium sp.]